MNSPHSPVIVGVAEVMEREGVSEPCRLMAEAVRGAARDAGADLLADIDSVDIVNEISWPYPDAVGRLNELLGVAPRRAVYGPVGGETPIRAIHEAALRIASGESEVAVVCGAEAESAVRRAGREDRTLDWPARVEDFVPLRSGQAQSDLARRLDVAVPAHVYPFYENATRAAWGLSFDAANRESAEVWARLSAIAESRPAAWQKRRHEADEIATPSADNRLIAWPYPKLMIANPTVNQGAAILLTSIGKARAAGIPEDRFVHVWGGAAANEPADYLQRGPYDRAGAMRSALDGALAVRDREGRDAFDAVELYSCFPVVPKMARRHLRMSADAPISVTGGLTFFGAPLNNYMGHAAVAMVERLRASGDGVGLLYGQGGYLSKHHALVVGRRPPQAPLTGDYFDARTEVPAEVALAADYAGPARIETYTVLFDRAGQPRHGVVIARTPDEARLLARVPCSDEASLRRLLDTSTEPVGAAGVVVPAPDGVPEWRVG